VWLSPTWQGMVAVDGLLEAEAGATLLAALEPLARPADAGDDRTGRQRNADALVELARRSLEGGWLPKAGGVRPQLLVTVDLDSLLGRPHGLGGETGWAVPLDSEACRRLACDGAVTRLLVSRHPSGPGQADRCHGEQEAGATRDLHQDTDATQDRNQAAEASGDPRTVADGPANLAAWLRAAVAKLPRPWVAPPASPWRSAGPPGWCSRPSAPPWPCETAAVSSRTVIGPWPGATPIICGTGSTAAPPTWPTWRWCAGPTIGPCMRAAGS
jgi:hypothetical protein